MRVVRQIRECLRARRQQTQALLQLNSQINEVLRELSMTALEGVAQVAAVAVAVAVEEERVVVEEQGRDPVVLQTFVWRDFACWGVEEVLAAGEYWKCSVKAEGYLFAQWVDRGLVQLKQALVGHPSWCLPFDVA